jgi:cytochrome c biogenesis protein CcmG/thiol:disulfide interchange protein DsbE
MSNNNDFVEKRLGALNEPEGFQPSVGRAKIRLQGRTAPPSRRWMWAAVPVTAALLLVLAVPGARATMGMSDHPIDFHKIHYIVRYHWTALVAMIHGPERAPDFTLTDAGGKEVQLSDYRGKVVLLNFWATWCEPCKAEVPWFVDLQKTYKDDLVVLGVSFDEDGWNAVRPFIEERKVNYPVMIAGPELPEQYRKIESLPATLMIDRDGRIKGTHLGLASKAQYEALIKDQL